MLNLIEAGEYTIIKKSKHGIYIDYKGSKLFLPKTVVNLDEVEICNNTKTKDKGNKK